MMGEMEEIIVFFFEYMYFHQKKKSREKETYFDIICRFFFSETR